MVRRVNPLLKEGSLIYFSHPRHLKIYRIYAGFIAILLIVLWPKNDSINYIQFERIPVTFTGIIIAVLICLTYLNTLFAFEGIKKEDLIHPRAHKDIVALKAGPRAGAELFLGVLHTLIMVFISLPFFLIAAVPSGTHMSGVLMSIATLLLCTVAYRAIGIFFNIVFNSAPALLLLGCVSSIAFFLIISIFVLPQANPILAVLGINSSFMPDTVFTQGLGIMFFSFRQTIYLHALILLAFTLMAYSYLKVQDWRRKIYRVPGSTFGDSTNNQSIGEEEEEEIT